MTVTFRVDGVSVSSEVVGSTVTPIVVSDTSDSSLSVSVAPDVTVAPDTSVTPDAAVTSVILVAFDVSVTFDSTVKLDVSTTVGVSVTFPRISSFNAEASVLGLNGCEVDVNKLEVSDSCSVTCVRAWMLTRSVLESVVVASCSIPVVKDTLLVESSAKGANVECHSGTSVVRAIVERGK